MAYSFPPIIESRLEFIGEDLPEEVKDMLYDYDKQTKQLQEMIRKYETPAKAIRKGPDLYLCPECRRRVDPRHSYCHRCGKMMAREGRRKK